MDEQKECKNCGFTTDELFDYCPKCGHKIKQSANSIKHQTQVAAINDCYEKIIGLLDPKGYLTVQKCDNEIKYSLSPRYEGSMFDLNSILTVGNQANQIIKELEVHWEEITFEGLTKQFAFSQSDYFATYRLVAPILTYNKYDEKWETRMHTLFSISVYAFNCSEFYKAMGTEDLDKFCNHYSELVKDIYEKIDKLSKLLTCARDVLGLIDKTTEGTKTNDC